MKGKIFGIIIGIFLLIMLFSKFLIHSKCKGNEGIPWWPNSGCDCKGIILTTHKQPEGTVGGGADYCIGILKEY